MELSKTKSVCTASTESLGRMLEASLKDLAVNFEKTVKSLGVGLGAGVRRNTNAMATRIRNLAARIHRFRMLKQLGFDTSMLLRTGGKQAMTYGLGIIGIADGMLRNMRRVAAAIASPATGTGGQNLDAALIVADGGPSGCADPAFDAHLLPIGEWAAAVWSERLPVESMQRLIAVGKRQIAKAKNIWAICRGPGTAFIATCRRLKWTVKDAITIVTDDGKVMQLNLDSPAAVVVQVKLSIKRWRWRNLEKTLPQLAKGGSGNGALMGPVWKLLKSKQNDEEWNPACRGALKSSLAARQYPQTRVFAAGWSEHNRCILCLYDIIQADTAKNGTIPTSVGEGAAARRLGVGAVMKVVTSLVEAPTLSSMSRKTRSKRSWQQLGKSAGPHLATATTEYGGAKHSQ